MTAADRPRRAGPGGARRGRGPRGRMARPPRAAPPTRRRPPPRGTATADRPRLAPRARPPESRREVEGGGAGARERGSDRRVLASVPGRWRGPLAGPAGSRAARDPADGSRLLTNQGAPPARGGLGMGSNRGTRSRRRLVCDGGSDGGERVPPSPPARSPSAALPGFDRPPACISVRAPAFPACLPASVRLPACLHLAV
jgi:hypothetical protein